MRGLLASLIVLFCCVKAQCQDAAKIITTVSRTATYGGTRTDHAVYDSAGHLLSTVSVVTFPSGGATKDFCFLRIGCDTYPFYPEAVKRIVRQEPHVAEGVPCIQLTLEDSTSVVRKIKTRVSYY